MKAIYAVPATFALVYRAWSHQSLTPAGIAAAVITAIAHAYHPWNLPFALLCVFFLAGTRATKVKKDIKTTLTVASQGTPGGEGPRTHVQVFANSLMASCLSLLHAYQLNKRKDAILDTTTPNPSGTLCFSWGGDLLVIGIIANYAAVAADTFSSELGILAKSEPRLITSPTFRKVPRGTNGGVTPLGIAAGALGSMIIVTTSMVFLPLCGEGTAGKVGGGLSGWTTQQRSTLMLGLTAWGVLGSLLDSVLGAVFQRSVKDVRSGKIVEGEGGTKVLISGDSSDHADKNQKRAAVKAAVLHGEGKAAVEKMEKTDSAIEDIDAPEMSADATRYDPKDKHRKSSFGDAQPSRVIETGWDLLDNNDVNFLMAFTMSMGAMGVAGWYWGVPLESILDA
ncbi:Protein PGR [Colletotrichum sp. SAR 10_99]|nr:Protein PGR [Colletotrichum sp. SAR 10_96]KAI8265933.1 Protein PGR [Colletotrichum sp. SAR 10_98]KAJ5012181.1 Protein PGR [Colletotrichum sp. SAR 10_99]